MSRFVLFFGFLALLCLCQHSQGATSVRLAAQRLTRNQDETKEVDNTNDRHDLANGAEEEDEDTNGLAFNGNDLDENEEDDHFDETDDTGSRRRRARRRNGRRAGRRNRKRAGGRKGNRRRTRG